MAQQPPIRCWCGDLFANKYLEYLKYVRLGFLERDAMDKIGIGFDKYCCRQLLLTTVPYTGISVPKEPPKGSRFTFRSVELYNKKKIDKVEPCIEDFQKKNENDDASFILCV